MHVDENTPGSLANREAVRVLKGWRVALYVVDFLVCIFWGLDKNLSIPYAFWLLFQSLFFSYFVGIVLLVITVRYFGRLIGIAKITPVGLMRYCVLFGVVSVIMGGVLVYRVPSSTPTVRADASKSP